MNEKKCRELRRELRNKNISIVGEPYRQFDNGVIMASHGRNIYQNCKKEGIIK